MDWFWSYSLTICSFISETLIFSNTPYFTANKRCRARHVGNFESPGWHLTEVKCSNSSYLPSSELQWTSWVVKYLREHPALLQKYEINYLVFLDAVGLDTYQQTPAKALPCSSSTQWTGGRKWGGGRGIWSYHYQLYNQWHHKAISSCVTRNEITASLSAHCARVSGPRVTSLPVTHMEMIFWYWYMPLTCLSPHPQYTRDCQGLSLPRAQSSYAQSFICTKRCDARAIAGQF